VNHRVSQIALLVAVTAASPASVSARRLDPATLDAVVETALRTWDVPGVAVVVVSPERTLWLKGYGLRDVAANEPMTPDTLFPLASCSKAFTTTLAAMLVADGKLAWDDPVRKHLPNFHLVDPLADASVTLRDLFAHRAGLANNDFLWYRAPWPLADAVKRTCRMPLAKPFRTTFQYQSAMYTAAGFAEAQAGGDSWEAQVRRRIFEPLGMKSARCMTPSAGQAPDRASPYRAAGDGQIRPIPWYVQTEANPAGSVHVSARDLAGWLRFQLGDGTFDGKRLVTAAALGETHTPQIVIPMDDAIRAANPDTVQMSYGLGWVIQDYRGHELVSHGGVIDGFRAHITLMSRDGFALALLSNRHQTRLNQALTNTLIDRLLGLTPRDWNDYFQRLEKRTNDLKREARTERDKLRRPDQALPRQLTDYIGEYDHPAYGRAHVTVEDGKLVWQWSTFRGVLAHHHGDEFDLENEILDNPPLSFQADGAGKTSKMIFLNLEFKRL
jgi:CubicO group peptidase (beta-lactamase class C family)